MMTPEERKARLDAVKSWAAMARAMMTTCFPRDKTTGIDHVEWLLNEIGRLEKQYEEIIEAFKRGRRNAFTGRMLSGPMSWSDDDT